MKKLLISLLLVLALTLTVFCPAEESDTLTDGTAEAIDPIVATIGGYEIYASDLVSMASLLYYNGITDSYDDYETALKYVLYNKTLPAIKVNEEGIDNLLGADEAARLKEEAAQQFEEAINEYIIYYYGEDLDEETLAAAREEAELYYKQNMNYDAESYPTEYVNSAAFDKYLERFDLSATDEEILAAYNEEAEYEYETFKDNILMYEYYVNYYGYQLYCRPDGYRAVLHILLDADEEALTAYNAAESDEDKQTAKEAVIASVQDTLDEIYAAYAAGTPFTELIATYNTDPGMQDETYLANGYEVHKDSIAYATEFTAGAFDEKMLAPGDVSDPVVTSYGVHVLYYLKDLPGGALEITDSIYEQIAEYLYNANANAKLDELLEDYEIVYEDYYYTLLG